MKKVKIFTRVMPTILITAIVALGFSIPVSADSDTVTPFHFSSFSADYYLSRNTEGFSELKVEETLVAEFQKIGNYNHGIERALPKFYKFDGNAKTESHSFDLMIIGVSEQYSKRNDGDFTVLRIGDPDAMVHGTHKYVIRWSAKNVTRNFDDGDEFYWNANGTGWSQYFEIVEARVHVPAHLVSELDGRIKCVVGRLNTTGRECDIEIIDEEDGDKVFIFKSPNVAAGETLTFDVGFKPGTFEKPPFDIGAVFGTTSGQFWFIVISAGILMIIASWRLVVVVQKFRPTKTGRAIIPEYLPPKELSVAESAFWYSSTRGSQTFMSATMMNFAVNHYVEIVEDKKKIGGKKFSLKLAKMPDDRLSDDEREILTTIFNEHLEVGQIIKTTDFQKNKELTKLVTSLPDRIQDRFYNVKNFYRVKPSKGIIPTTVILAISIAAMIICVALLEIESVIVCVFLAPLAISVVSMAIYRPISLRGMEMKEYLKGLKMYMKLAESERIKVLQSVKNAERVMTDSGEIVKLYEKLLPYAVIFGITKDWAKALKVYYDENPSLAPIWYVGSISSFGSFDTTSFANSINSFSSSGSGFSSGSGGGAGGGGGGGGGGGW